jgi:hypothetical protein
LKRLQNDATAKTTLKYLAIKHLEIGTSHSLVYTDLSINDLFNF